MTRPEFFDLDSLYMLPMYESFDRLIDHTHVVPDDDRNVDDAVASDSSGSPAADNQDAAAGGSR
jgi:hypothetical protein